MSDTCPECGKLVSVVDDTIALHSNPAGEMCGAGLKKRRSVISAKRIRGAEDEAASLRARIAGLDSALTQERIMHGATRQSLQQTDARIATLEARIAELTREREATRDAKIAYRAENARVSARSAKLQLHLGAMTEVARAARARNAELEREREAVAREAGDYQVAITAMSYDLTHARAERDEAVGLLDKCVEAMEMQERRERGEFHLSQPAAKAIWDEAKDKANAYLYRLVATGARLAPAPEKETTP